MVTAGVLVGALVVGGVLLLPRARCDRLRTLAPGVAHRGPGPWWARAGRARVLRWLPAQRHPRPATDVAAVTAELAGLVRGGLPPAAAWAAVRPGLGPDPAGRLLAAAAAAGARGEPVADLLTAPAPGRRWPGRSTAGAVTARRLAGLAAAVAVHERTGAPVADVLDRAAAGLRSDDDADLARRSALAAPLATARVLVALPALGLLLGVAVGADPVHVLVGEPVGRWCAAVGAGCALAGWRWSRSLVRRAVVGP